MFCMFSVCRQTKERSALLHWTRMAHSKQYEDAVLGLASCDGRLAGITH